MAACPVHGQETTSNTNILWLTLIGILMIKRPLSLIIWSVIHSTQSTFPAGMNLAQLFLIICCSLSGQQGKCMKHTLDNCVIYSCMDAALAAVGLVEDEVSYEVGDDFCLDEDSPPVELTCEGTGTTVQWLHDGAVVFDGEKMNMDFFTNGTNILLAPGVVNPPPFILKDDYSITFNLQAPSLSSPLAGHPEITSDNIQMNLFEGSWTCVQQNTHNTVSETSKISPCGEFRLSYIVQP